MLSAQTERFVAPRQPKGLSRRANRRVVRIRPPKGARPRKARAPHDRPAAPRDDATTLRFALTRQPGAGHLERSCPRQIPPRSSLSFAGLVALARSLNPIPSRTRPLNSSAPMVLCLKTWESRSSPGLPRTTPPRTTPPGMTPDPGQRPSSQRPHRTERPAPNPLASRPPHNPRPRQRRSPDPSKRGTPSRNRP